MRTSRRWAVAEVKLPLEKLQSEGRLLADRFLLHATRKCHGHDGDIASPGISFRYRRTRPSSVPAPACKLPPLRHYQTAILRVTANDVPLTLVIRCTGALTSIDVGDRELLAGPLVPNFWKVPNDNQYRNQYLKRLGAWSTAAARRTDIEMKTNVTGRQIVVDVKSKLPVGASHTICDTRSRPDGHIHVKADYRPGRADSAASAVRNAVGSAPADQFGSLVWSRTARNLLGPKNGRRNRRF